MRTFSEKVRPRQRRSPRHGIRRVCRATRPTPRPLGVHPKGSRSWSIDPFARLGRRPVRLWHRHHWPGRLAGHYRREVALCPSVAACLRVHDRGDGRRRSMTPGGEDDRRPRGMFSSAVEKPRRGPSERQATEPSVGASTPGTTADCTCRRQKTVTNRPRAPMNRPSPTAVR